MVCGEEKISRSILRRNLPVGKIRGCDIARGKWIPCLGIGSLVGSVHSRLKGGADEQVFQDMCMSDRG